jgi:hypothetical protein
MANKKISELPAAGALTGAELAEAVQGGVNVQTTLTAIAALGGGGGHVIEDEGTPLTQRTKLNFVGGGVAVTDDSGDDASVVTIALQGVRSIAVASTATLTPDLDNYDSFAVTAQAAGLTIANPTGTLQDMRQFVIRIKDNGTPRVISYGTKYRVMEITLPVTTVISKYLFLQCVVNAVDDKIDVVAVVNEI